jgi:hypothetical protein
LPWAKINWTLANADLQFSPNRILNLMRLTTPLRLCMKIFSVFSVVKTLRIPVFAYKQREFPYYLTFSSFRHLTIYLYINNKTKLITNNLNNKHINTDNKHNNLNNFQENMNKRQKPRMLLLFNLDNSIINLNIFHFNKNNLLQSMTHKHINTQHKI